MEESRSMSAVSHAETPPPDVDAATPRKGLLRGGVRTATGLILAGLVLLLLVALSLAIGSKSVPLSDVWHALFDPTGSPSEDVIRQLRVPRTALAVLVGAALALAGALMQALSRNPLADPGLLGVNAGASLGVVLAIAVFGVTSLGGYVWFSIGGAAIATVAVYALGSVGRAGVSPVRMVLAGAAIAAVAGGFTSAVVLTDLAVFNGIRSWSVGSLAGRDASVLLQVAPFILVGVVATLLMAGPLNALGLGDDTARALGAKVELIRIWGVVAVTLLAGAATAAVGPIVFLGLVIPHLARTFTGPNYRWILPYCLILGPILILASDIVGRIVVRPAELEVAVVLALIGAPVFIAIARRPRLSELS